MISSVWLGMRCVSCWCMRGGCRRSRGDAGRLVWGTRGEGGGGRCRVHLSSVAVCLQPLQEQYARDTTCAVPRDPLIPDHLLPLTSRSICTTLLLFKLGKPSWAQIKAGNNCKIMIGVRITYGLKATNH